MGCIFLSDSQAAAQYYQGSNEPYSITLTSHSEVLLHSLVRNLQFIGKTQRIRGIEGELAVLHLNMPPQHICDLCLPVSKTSSERDLSLNSYVTLN